jgi:hypothetical protein
MILIIGSAVFLCFGTVESSYANTSNTLHPETFIVGHTYPDLDMQTQLSKNKMNPETEQSIVPTHKTKLFEEIEMGIIYKTLFYGISQKPLKSSLNPNNEFLQIPRYTLESEFRPNISIDYDMVRLSAKPRLNLSRKRWKFDIRDDETDIDHDFFINEWLASLRFFQEVYISYGRENLQWGPSFFISPSNPFFRDNGLSNPKLEVPGLDFARLVWVPSSSWTLSLIANLGEGRQEFFDEFERTYAVKLDYTTYQKYFSFIASYQESGKDAQGNRNNDIERARLGGFIGWTFSDALILYAEASGTMRNNALYPVEDTTSPFGFQMTSATEDEDSFEGLVLIGGSYTLEIGPTLTMEYAFNSAGYNDEEAERYFELQTRASENFFSPQPLYSLSRLTLNQTLNPGLRLLRKNYIMLQYQHIRIRDVFDVIARYIYNMDDNSSQFIPIIQYDFGNNLLLFLIGAQNFGSRNTEFRLLTDYSYMMGLEFAF